MITPEEEVALQQGIAQHLPDVGIIDPADERNAIWLLYSLIKSKLAIIAPPADPENPDAPVFGIADINGLQEALNKLTADMGMLALSLEETDGKADQNRLDIDAQLQIIQAIQLLLSEYNLDAYNALDMETPGRYLDAAQGKVLYELIQQISTGGGTDPGTGGGTPGIGSSGSGISWLITPLVRLNPDYSVEVLNEAPNEPTAYWPGSDPVVYDSNIIFPALVPPADGMHRIDAIDVGQSGGYYYLEGVSSATAGATPALLNNRLRATTIIWVGSTGSVYYPPESQGYWGAMPKSQTNSQTIEQYFQSLGGGSTVTDSTVNGNILVDGAELPVFDSTALINKDAAQDARLAALEAEEPPVMPAGATWTKQPVVTLSGTNNEIINVSEGILNNNGPTVTYAATTFTATLPASPNIRQDLIQALASSTATGTYNYKTGTPGLTVTRPSLTLNAIWVGDVILSSEGGTVKNSVRIVQVPGTSTTAVMSQDAATREDNKKISKSTTYKPINGFLSMTRAEHTALAVKDPTIIYFLED